MADTNEYGGIRLSVKIDTSHIKHDVDTIVKQCSEKFRQLGQTISRAFATPSDIDELRSTISSYEEMLRDMEQNYARLVAQEQGMSERAEFLKGNISAVKKEIEALREALNLLEGEKKASSFAEGVRKVAFQVKSLMTRLLLVQTIYKAARAVLSYFKQILKADEQISQDWEEIKTALKIAIQPFVDTLVPVIKTLVPWIKDFAIAIGQFMAAVSGKSYSDMAKIAKVTQQAADAYGDMVDSSAETAKNTEKQLASFDDIQILKSDDSKKSDYSSYDEALADSEGIGGLVGALSNIVEGAIDAMPQILNAVYGALRGIIGAIGEMLPQLITAIVRLVKHIVKTLPEILTDFVDAVIEIVPEIISAIIGCLPDIITGLIELIMGIVDALPEIITALIDEIPDLIGMIVDTVIDTLPALLDCVGDLIVAIVEALPELSVKLFSATLEIVKALFASIVKLSPKLTAAVWELIGYVIAEIPRIAIRLQELSLKMVLSSWNAIKGFWDTNIAPIFAAQWWLNLGKNCINGLIAGFEGGINGIINAFESMINWIVGGLNKISFDIPDWLGGGSFGINLPKANLGRVSIPRLAKGAVIPANREFLAVLGDQKHGTNIETPLETMVDAFNIAMDSRNDTVKEERYFLGETELMQIVYKLAKKGERLQGADLIN